MATITQEGVIMDNQLPKLYRPVKIRFSSLRNAIGENGGVMFDCDQMVERTAMRVNTGNGWKWQIKDISTIWEWDYFAESDQEILTEHGSDIEYEIVD